jgi:hypothetical protein
VDVSESLVAEGSLSSAPILDDVGGVPETASTHSDDTGNRAVGSKGIEARTVVTSTRKTLQRHNVQSPTIESAPQPSRPPESLRASEVTAQRIGAASAAQDVSVGAASELARGLRNKAIAVGKARTISGWTAIPEGYIKATPEQVAEHAKGIGHQLPPVPGKDQLPRGGFEGKFFASHAEKQQIVALPNEPVGVSRPMCDDCIAFFKREARFRRQDQVVSDPQTTRVFEPSGEVTEYWKDGTTIRFAPDGRSVKVRPTIE